MSDIPTFHADGQAVIHHAGHALTVWTGHCPADWTNRSDAIGAQVIMDGTVRTVAMLESYATPLGPEIGAPIGLVFKDETDAT
jgi:hypothetical protein